MTKINGLRTIAVIIGVAFLGACGDDTSPLTQAAPAPGMLTLHLTTPNSDDGALSVVVQGEGMESPIALNAGHQVFTATDSEEGELRLALVGNGLSGALVQFWVPDVNRLQSYTASLMQVADEASDLRRNLEGYRVGIARSP